MKSILLIITVLFLASCQSVSDTPINELDPKLRTVTTNCKTCHSPNATQRGPLLEGLEEWYLKSSTNRFRLGLRGTNKADTQGQIMHAAVKEIPEEDVLKAVEWFAGQERPEIKATVKGDIEVGGKIYKESCYGCHEHTMGKFFSKSPDLYKMEDWYMLAQLRSYKKAWRGSETDDNHGANMRVAVDTLNDKDFKDVVAYLATFKEKP